MFGLGVAEYPRQDSNLCTRFRKPLLYPLSYGGICPHFTKESAPLNGEPLPIRTGIAYPRI
jgi:hypothetical protein